MQKQILHRFTLAESTGAQTLSCNQGMFDHVYSGKKCDMPNNVKAKGKLIYSTVFRPHMKWGNQSYKLQSRCDSGKEENALILSHARSGAQQHWIGRCTTLVRVKYFNMYGMAWSPEDQSNQFVEPPTTYLAPPAGSHAWFRAKYHKFEMDRHEMRYSSRSERNLHIHQITVKLLGKLFD